MCKNDHVSWSHLLVGLLFFFKKGAKSKIIIITRRKKERICAAIHLGIAGRRGIRPCSVSGLCRLEVVHWRRNIFCVPSGSAEKAFVLEVSRLIRAFCEGSALETVAMKAIMILPHVVLQKPHPSSTAKEHHACLERRLAAWKQRDIDGLIREGRTIQHHLRTSS